MSADNCGDKMDDTVGVCRVCNTTFTHKREKEFHYQGTPHKVNKMRKDISSLFDLDLNSGNYYVYTILINPVNHAKNFYYVGTSYKPFERIGEHMKSKGNVSVGNIPSDDNKKLVRKSYDFIRFVDIEEYKTQQKARLRERQKMFEIAKEHDQDMVLGGQ